MPMTTPQNAPAEEAALGCLFATASPLKLPLTEDHFAAPDHRLIFRAIRDLAERGHPVTPQTVTSFLTAEGQLENAGGAYRVSELYMSGAGGDASLAHYFPDLENARRNRVAVLHIHKCLPELSSLKMDAAQFADSLVSIAAPITHGARGDSVSEIIAEREARLARGEVPEHFPTKLALLDHHLKGGFVRGELAVVAANTGGGKSALLVQAAVANAAAGRKVIYYTTELSPDALTDRAAAAYRNVSMNDERKMRSALCDLCALPLIFRSDYGDLVSICADITAEVRGGNCDFVIVDYVQRITGRGDSREQEVAGIARTLKSLAMREKVPIFTASQLNDDGALRESRAIGHEADCVLLVREENLIVNKFRRGPAGVALHCRLQGETSRFVETQE